MVTLTGTFTRLDGTPATGTVRVTPSRSPIMDPDGKVVISGPQVFPLGVDGTLSVPIPASNDPDLGPPFTYWIDVNLTHASWKINKVWVPHGSATVDLSEIADYTPVPGVATRVVTIPADGTDGQVLVWDGVGFSWDFPPEGPQGPPGEVTTAALTTALAGKVTGTGMTVRVDTSAGTRVFLDHPGGSLMLHGDTGWRDMSERFSGGWTGKLIARRINDTVELRFSELDGTNATQNGLASSLLPFGSSYGRLTAFALNGDGGSSGTEMKYLSTSGTYNQLWRGRPTDFAGTGAATVVFTTTYPWPTSLPGLPL